MAREWGQGGLGWGVFELARRTVAVSFAIWASLVTLALRATSSSISSFWQRVSSCVALLVCHCFLSLCCSSQLNESMFAGGSSSRSSSSCSRRSRRFTASGFVWPRLPEGVAWMK